jgi:heme/copper-type cytochrome/quinol oxidase subunit 3
MTTGLHALHVIAGVLFLTVGLIRVTRESFTTEHHLGMEFAIFYWHLVDVVWLLVFVVYYWWGGDPTLPESGSTESTFLHDSSSSFHYVEY